LHIVQWVSLIHISVCFQRFFSEMFTKYVLTNFCDNALRLNTEIRPIAAIVP